MRIVDPFYVSTILTIMIGIGFLSYTKIYMQPSQTFHIVISGSKIQSFLFAYQIYKLNMANINITMIGKFDPEIIKFLDSGDLDYDNIHMPSLNSPYIDRKILQFCGDEPLLRELLEDTHLQYKVKRSQILFNKGLSSINEVDSFIDNTYRIDQEGMTAETVYKYGLSHQTAKWIFNSFQSHLHTLTYSVESDKSIRGILNTIMPLSHKPASNGLEYLSETIGLDQKYIRDYINPLISSSYFQNVNSVAMLFKILPLFCNANYDKHNSQPKLNSFGRKNNVLAFDERLMAVKILQKMRESHAPISIIDTKLLEFEEMANHKVLLKIGNRSPFHQLNQTNHEILIDADTLCILEDLEEENERQISYYRTIVDGCIEKDEQQQEVYTMYFQNQVVLSVTRLCANDCKKFRSNVYLVISKSKLQSKDLNMFTEHTMHGSFKYKKPRPHLQSSSIKFQQTPHVLRILDTELISDSYEMKLIIFRNLANLIKRKATNFKHYEARKTTLPQQFDLNIQ